MREWVLQQGGKSKSEEVTVQLIRAHAVLWRVFWERRLPAKGEVLRGDVASSSSVKVWTPSICVMVIEPLAPDPADRNMGKTKIKYIKGSQRLQNSCEAARGLQGPMEQEGLLGLYGGVWTQVIL